jgi:hypothetical protein
MSGRTLTIGAAGFIQLFRVSQPASVSRVSLTDLARSPRVRLQVSTAAGSAPLASVALALPRALRLNRSQRVLRRDAKLSPSGLITRPHAGTVLLTLNKPAATASLSIGAGALALSTNTKRALATIRMHKRHRSLTFKVSVIATDSQGQTTKTIFAFNLR